MATKKLLSKFVATLLVLSMALAIAMPILAAEDDDDWDLGEPELTYEQIEILIPVWIPVTAEEQKQAILDDPYLTDEEKQFHINRFALFEFDGDLSDIANLPHEIQALLADAERISGRSFDFGNIFLPVRHFPQLRNNWCGPATVQQTVRYWIPQNTQTQEQFWAGFHHSAPDLPMMRNAVNNQMTAFDIPRRYASARITNRNILHNTISMAMQFGIPPMIRIEPLNTMHWPYSLNFGHFLNVSGILICAIDGVSISNVQFTDPWMGSSFFNPGSNGTFWRNLDDLLVVMISSRDAAERDNFAW